MTSQKRYRHHQENNSNNSRFRDIPPRFKRQKSSSAPSPPPAATSLATQKSSTVNHNPAIQRADSVKSPAAMAPSSTSVYPVEGNCSPQSRPRIDILQAPRVPVSAALQWPQNINGAFVLSPWDSGHMNRVQNTRSRVPLGTHFSYELNNSPPLSPWAPGSILNMTGQQNATGNPAQNVTGSPTWITSQTDPYMCQKINSSPVYFDSENWTPSQNVMHHHGPNTVWGKLPSPSPQCSSPSSSPKQISMPVVTKLTENSKSNVDKQNSVRAVVDYSDPDIRTIEMLRELERVADEKEIECGDSGVDRKSLVSHHLRMLMCAVDRYTEGIEDVIAEASQCDEAVTASNSRRATPKASPAPSELWPQKQVKEITREANSDSDTSLWSPGYQTSVWKNQAVKPVTPSVSDQSKVSVYSQKALYSSPQAFPVWGSKEIESQDIATWDLWSSPSFDFSGVLTNQSPENIFQNLVGRFSAKNERERKPLYQR